MVDVLETQDEFWITSTNYRNLVNTVRTYNDLMNLTTAAREEKTETFISNCYTNF